MDNGPYHLRYRPEPWTTVLAGVAAVLGLVLTVLASDPPSRVIFALATVITGAYAVGDLVFAPRLAADAGGLRIRTPATRADLRWDEITHVRADSRLRLGLRSTTLEVDAGSVLVVFSRRSLGADPEYVAAQLRELAPRSPGGPGRPGRPGGRGCPGDPGSPRTFGG